jgi:hypothetical protein
MLARGKGFASFDLVSFAGGWELTVSSGLGKRFRLVDLKVILRWRGILDQW